MKRTVRSRNVFLKSCLKFLLNRVGGGLASDLVDLGSAMVVYGSDLWRMKGSTQAVLGFWGKEIDEEHRQAEALSSTQIPLDDIRAQVVELISDQADGLPETDRAGLANILVEAYKGLEHWGLVSEKMHLDAESREVVRGLIRATMEHLGIEDLADSALAVNWVNDKRLAISYGGIKALDLQSRSKPPGFELWLPIKKERIGIFGPDRRPKKIYPLPGPEPDGFWKRAGLIQLRIVTGRPPSLTPAEREAWHEGLDAARKVGIGKTSGYRHGGKSLIGPWLLEMGIPQRTDDLRRF
jgi:hypothetical protein